MPDNDNDNPFAPQLIDGSGKLFVFTTNIVNCDVGLAELMGEIHTVRGISLTTMRDVTSVRLRISGCLIEPNAAGVSPLKMQLSESGELCITIQDALIKTGPL